MCVFVCLFYLVWLEGELLQDNHLNHMRGRSLSSDTIGIISAIGIATSCFDPQQLTAVVWAEEHGIASLGVPDSATVIIHPVLTANTKAVDPWFGAFLDR